MENYITLKDGTKKEIHDLYELTNNKDTIEVEGEFDIAKEICNNDTIRKINITVDNISSQGYTFSKLSSLEEASIKINSKSIGAYDTLFFECFNLRKVTYDGHKMEYTFEDCPRLSEVEIKDGCVFINDFSFYALTSLRELTFPKSVKSVSRSAIVRCNNLEIINFEGEDFHKIDDGFLSESHNMKQINFCNVKDIEGFKKKHKKFFEEYEDIINFDKEKMHGPEEIKLRDVIIDGRRDTFKHDEFRNNIFTRSVEISYGHNIIPYDRQRNFRECINLETVNLKNTSKLNSDFRRCLSLKTFNAPDLVSLQKCMFQSCLELEDVNVPNAETIGERCFEGCVNLKHVDCRSAMEICKEAFSGCTSLKELTLYSATVEGYAFEGSGIERLNIKGNAVFRPNSFLQLVKNTENLNEIYIESEFNLGAFDDDFERPIQIYLSYKVSKKFAEEFEARAFKCNPNIKVNYLTLENIIENNSFKEANRLANKYIEGKDR